MDKKIEQYIQDMKGRQLKRIPIAPWEYQLLWHFGVNVRPPLFQSLLVNALVTGREATIGFAGATVLFERVMRIGSADSVEQIALKSLCFGLILGYWIAYGYAKEFKRLALPKWDDYVPTTHIG